MPPANQQIRLARLEDIEPCVAIMADNFHIFLAEKRRQHFRQMIPQGGMIVLEQDDRIRAYASFDPDWFGCTFLKLVVVDHQFRRQGMASILISHIEHNHCPSGRFFSSTEADNLASIALHSRLGFVESGWLDNLPQPNRELFYCKLLPAAGPSAT